jgi:secondary thiamine-phosphate synthase enzyme
MYYKKELGLSTEKRYQLVDITDSVEEIVRKTGIRDGQVLVFVPHSTAALLLTENEEGLKKDWLDILKKLVSGFDFRHNRIDDNADSHILSGLVGQARILPIEEGRIVRGTWQQIFLAEFDGPKTRRVMISVIGS